MRSLRSSRYELSIIKPKIVACSELLTPHLGLYFAAGAGTPGTTAGTAAPGTAGTPGTALAGTLGVEVLAGAAGATPGTAEPGAGAAGAVCVKFCMIPVS